MKEYIRSRIIMSLEFAIIILLALFLKKETYTVSTLSVAKNNSLEKTLDVEIIQQNQKELFSKGTYNPVYSFIGELTGYAGDCPLCSGYLACPPKRNIL